ncbi:MULTISPECIES: DUF488 domain-containing protein [unclassified Streptomyces]|uniref:DUF488 domain-containing protein n=1 Tax=unclassified Streptomyces TaxID=2593676 RepID=UPI002E15B690|nr:DUF488 domain-containing protein [Streptomyces sp. NBC_01207]WTA19601.1 DUF488 domain-containing protein [Streptomyces sp. NBC_00853]
MKLYTIGFTKKSAAKFFGLLREAGVTALIDARLNNVSQLSGFAKRDDLKYFLGEICGAQYTHLTELAPTKEMLDAYKKRDVDWATYEVQFLELMKVRQIEDTIRRETLDNAVLLCSEDSPRNCHRRLVAEYLAQRWDDVTIEHLA